MVFSDLGSGGADRIFLSASSNEWGASVKGFPAFPAGLVVVFDAFMTYVRETISINFSITCVNFAGESRPLDLITFVSSPVNNRAGLMKDGSTGRSPATKSAVASKIESASRGYFVIMHKIISSPAKLATTRQGLSLDPAKLEKGNGQVGCEGGLMIVGCPSPLATMVCWPGPCAVAREVSACRSRRPRKVTQEQAAMQDGSNRQIA